MEEACLLTHSNFTSEQLIHYKLPYGFGTQSKMGQYGDLTETNPVIALYGQHIKSISCDLSISAAEQGRALTCQSDGGATLKTLNS